MEPELVPATVALLKVVFVNSAPLQGRTGQVGIG